MMEARLSSVIGAFYARVKGTIAEVSDVRCCAKVAGLRENMSQTVTKVEGYHWLEAGQTALYTYALCMTMSFSLCEKFMVFCLE